MVLGDSYDTALGQWRADAHALLSAQEFWFVVFMTVLCVFSHLSDDYCSCSIVSSYRGVPFERSLWRL